MSLYNRLHDTILINIANSNSYNVKNKKKRQTKIIVRLKSVSKKFYLQYKHSILFIQFSAKNSWSFALIFLLRKISDRNFIIRPFSKRKILNFSTLGLVRPDSLFNTTANIYARSGIGQKRDPLIWVPATRSNYYAIEKLMQIIARSERI